MTQPIIVAEIVQTCEACPSQWDATSDDKRAIYVRYRWGHLRVEWRDNLGSGDIYSEQVGGPLDGEMSYEELKLKLAGVLTLPEEQKRIDPLTGLPEDGP